MKKIAILTARSGSKGLPNKNVLLADGKPLIAYSIEAALEYGEFEKIIVSTDSQEYIDLLSHYPIEFIKRAEHLATDTASSFAVLEDVINQYDSLEYDYFVLLQPTSPLRNATHIREACDKFEHNFEQFDFCVSVADAHKPTSLTRPIEGDESLKHFQLDYSNYARQNYHPEFSPNGAIFSAKPAAYLKQKHFYGEKCIAYFMDRHSSVDIDDIIDFDYFRFILQQQKKDQILKEAIKQRIEQKEALFKRKCPITLIGHSILDQWAIQSLSGYEVNNLAISGISTQEYIEEIIDKGLIQELGEYVVIMSGTNDIVRQNWTNQSVQESIQLLINKLKAINPESKILFLEILPTALRTDRRNSDIRSLNFYLNQKLINVQWVETDEKFSNKYSKLDLAYSHDGLHLNAAGYQLLQSILEERL